MASKNTGSKKRSNGKPSKLSVWWSRLANIRKFKLASSPHRAFRHSRRRDYVRPLKLPGYFAFTAEVVQMLFKNRRMFGMVILLYALLIIMLGGLASQNIYQQIDDLIGTEDISIFNVVTQAGMAALLGFSTGNTALSEVQQAYLAIAFLLVWLSTVWLLREVMAGRKPKVRDGIYNSGAPIVSTTLVVLVMLIQLLPLGLLAIAYGGLLQAGLANEGIGAMLFFLVTLLTATLCLYWITATCLALVVVTLPGMYPMRALRLASEIVMGRRLKFMYRMLWLLGLILSIVLVTMAPVILLNQWLTHLADWVSLLPIVSIGYAVVGATVAVFASSYVYLLYRKVVEYDSSTER